MYQSTSLNNNPARAGAAAPPQYPFYAETKQSRLVKRDSAVKWFIIKPKPKPPLSLTTYKSAIFAVAFSSNMPRPGYKAKY